MFKRLLARIFGGGSAGKRVYDFKLPYVLTPFLLTVAINRLTRKGVFSKLPKDIQTRMLDAQSKRSSVTITQADLDEIDDATWASIASYLGLPWHDA